MKTANPIHTTRIIRAAAFAAALASGIAAAPATAGPADAQRIAYLDVSALRSAPGLTVATSGQGPARQLGAYRQPSPSADLAQRLERRFTTLLGARCAPPVVASGCPAVR